MAKKFYVGNLPYSASEDDIKKLFDDNGFAVTSVTLPKDRDSGRLRGFGFVELEVEDRDEVIKKMNSLEFEGRALKVDEAQDRQKTGGGGDRPRRSGGGFRGRGDFNRNHN